MSVINKKKSLKKELTLFDVYAISTGAMFSSGFFLLPGIASAGAGPAVVVAYLIGGFMVLPAMLSAAELSTALPRAGGPYYFLDRSLGPMVGAVGGLGTWFALIFKSAFALIGMGAYLAIFFDVPIKPVAIAFTLVFMALNIAGVKKSGQVQGILVVTLVGILIFFVVLGLFEVLSLDMGEIKSEQFTPFMPFGFEGLISTVGLIFVSYAGLTQVASVVEEVKNPDRNIPLGMILSLLTATIVYVLGVYVMVALIEADVLREDLTPVATAANVFMDWLPYGSGLILVVIAAIAAFASTGNAGIMSAARYPFAMARDKLVWKHFAKVGRFKTPTVSILVTSGVMIFFIIALNVEDIAKLASAFMLLIFGFLNVAVLILRESQIDEYDPGFYSPFYPWMQVAGIIITIWLIAVMGWLSILFTVGMVLACIVYYFYYAHEKVERSGAIFHLHARLGEKRYRGLEKEMRGILREKGLREEDPYEKVVGRSVVIDCNDKVPFKEITAQVSEELSKQVSISNKTIQEYFLQPSTEGALPMGHGAALKHIRIDDEMDTEVVIVRSQPGIDINKEYFELFGEDDSLADQKIHCLIFMMSSKKRSAQHLRILSHLAEVIDTSDFQERWKRAGNDSELREILLRDERFININVRETGSSQFMVGKKVKELDLPENTLVTVIKRGNELIYAHGNTTLNDGDEISVIGDKSAILEIKNRIGSDEA